MIVPPGSTIQDLEEAKALLLSPEFKPGAEEKELKIPVKLKGATHETRRVVGTATDSDG